ncbi:MAG: fumarylacetoacetate hydrolase [Gemmatimonas sp. SG8_17]|nr:MAG: fumarylacetoacetate hydrolase [Gemmatimonas sp. SG8_17]
MAAQPAWAQTGVTKYVRYLAGDETSYGVLQGQIIRELSGGLFDSPRPTGRTLQLSAVKLLAPCEPSKVIAVGLNYQSHLGEREPAEYPGLFAKFPTSIVGPESNIVMPPDATDLHYEGELVVVIGREARNVPVDEAGAYVFGVTAGNDVSERAWQRADLQWLRAKASDTFGPIGPAIVTGLDHNNLLVETRVNGEVRQSERSSDLIFDIETIVSYVSRYVTLMPGDVIFTGTPGSTQAMQPGDVIEVEVEGVGVLRNTVVVATGR